MLASVSIFLEINLPNAATWFYFSILLGVALFFKFSRLFSVRNWDILTLYLIVPGLFLVQEGGQSDRWGYIWLLSVSGYFWVRCLFDLTLERRPALAPNLNLAGLLWFAVALYVSLITVAVWQPPFPRRAGEPQGAIGGITKPITDKVENMVAGKVPNGDLSPAVERALILACHLTIVVGMTLVGWRLFDDLHGGVAAATFYLLLPYTHILLPWNRLDVGRWDHAWPMACMVWMLLTYRLPILCGSFFGIAAGSVFFPALAFPIWFSFFWGRGAGRFTVAFVFATGATLGILSLILWASGGVPLSLHSVWSPNNWLPWLPPSAEARGIWVGEPWPYRLPVSLVYLVFVIATFFWPAPKNLAHVMALTVAVMLGIQFWFGDQGGVYVFWYLPYLLLLVFRPNLSDRRPPPLADDWIARSTRAVGRWLFGLVQQTEQVVTTART